MDDKIKVRVEHMDRDINVVMILTKEQYKLLKFLNDRNLTDVIIEEITDDNVIDLTMN